MRKMVGRDGIEPPTPGFSVVRAASRNSAKCLSCGDLGGLPPLVPVGAHEAAMRPRGHGMGTRRALPMTVTTSPGTRRTALRHIHRGLGGRRVNAIKQITKGMRHQEPTAPIVE